jgi:hypothetical protein
MASANGTSAAIVNLSFGRRMALLLNLIPSGVAALQEFATGRPARGRAGRSASRAREEPKCAVS